MFKKSVVQHKQHPISPLSTHFFTSSKSSFFETHIIIYNKQAKVTSQ